MFGPPPQQYVSDLSREVNLTETQQAEVLKLREGLPGMATVVFPGGGDALKALLTGTVQLSSGVLAPAHPQIKAGKLRPLAGWGAKRVESLPDVPTFKEQGYDIEFYIWAGLFAPRGTPEPVMKTIREAVRQAVNTPEFKTAMEKLQTPIAYLDAPEFQKFWDKDAKMLADAIKRVGKVEIPEAK